MECSVLAIKFISSSGPVHDSTREVIWAENLDHKTLQLATFYRPNVHDEESLYHLCSSLDKLGMDSSANMILACDMNFPRLNWAERRLKGGTTNPSAHLQFGNMLNDYNLVQMVEEPTPALNTLDLICFNNPLKFNRVHTTAGISNHERVYAMNE